MQRRELIRNLGLGILGGSAAGFAPRALRAQPTLLAQYTDTSRGSRPTKITRIRAIATAPEDLELIVVKVETDEPGLYGIGCATFRQRAHAVVSAVNDYLAPLCTGKVADNIEDIWQIVYQSSYWRNGPVLNNALSGLDQALWDIKAKKANMPLYQLLGGKCRFAVDTYIHADAETREEVVENIQRDREKGYRHFRIQEGVYGSMSSSGADFRKAGFGEASDNLFDAERYLKKTPELFAYVRKHCGDDVEILHDIHERVQPWDAINLCKKLEQYRPYFIEDPFSPENIGYFEHLRQHTTVPIAMGELFNSPHEWLEPVTKRWYDFIRIHISQIGGITPAMKVARLCEWYNVRTAWHGPGDVSPVGHAANVHVDLAIWNFGIQEVPSSIHSPTEAMRSVFTGLPWVENGYVHVNDKPGLGIDINEEEAAKFPIPDVQLNNWTQLRKQDGTVVRP